MSPEEPEKEGVPGPKIETPPSPEPVRGAAPGRAEAPAPKEPAPEKAEASEAFIEDYEEYIEPEKPQRPRKKLPVVPIIVTVAIVLVLVSWTLLSPEIMPEVGGTYIESPTYAGWGNYTGYRDIWAGNTTWGVAISGHATAAGNRQIEVNVLITKVFERPGNWFFRGTAISLRNVSVFADDGTFLGSMSNSTNLGFGVLATVPVSFAANGTYDLYVTAKFLVYEVMRLGFVPLEMVNVQQVYLDVPVVVT